MFPPTFLYTQSWEDPRTDEPHLQINDQDVCLTLTSGGCNSLALCLHGARKVSGKRRLRACARACGLVACTRVLAARDRAQASGCTRASM